MVRNLINITLLISVYLLLYMVAKNGEYQRENVDHMGFMHHLYKKSNPDSLAKFILCESDTTDKCLEIMHHLVEAEFSKIPPNSRLYHQLDSNGVPDSIKVLELEVSFQILAKREEFTKYEIERRVRRVLAYRRSRGQK